MTSSAAESPTIEQITLNADDIQAAGTAVQHLEPKDPVEITRGNGMTVLTWHTNGTTGATIHDGQIVSDDEPSSDSEPEGSA